MAMFWRLLCEAWVHGRQYLPRAGCSGEFVSIYSNPSGSYSHVTTKFSGL